MPGDVARLGQVCAQRRPFLTLLFPLPSLLLLFFSLPCTSHPSSPHFLPHAFATATVFVPSSRVLISLLSTFPPSNASASPKPPPKPALPSPVEWPASACLCTARPHQQTPPLTSDHQPQAATVFASGAHQKYRRRRLMLNGS